jgi:hypothetical protein
MFSDGPASHISVIVMTTGAAPWAVVAVHQSRPDAALHHILLERKREITQTKNPIAKRCSDAIWPLEHSILRRSIMSIAPHHANLRSDGPDRIPPVVLSFSLAIVALTRPNKIPSPPFSLHDVAAGSFCIARRRQLLTPSYAGEAPRSSTTLSPH